MTLSKALPALTIKPHQDKDIRDRRNGLLLAVLTRMLFSALIDADRLTPKHSMRRLMAANCRRVAAGRHLKY